MRETGCDEPLIQTGETKVYPSGINGPGRNRGWAAFQNQFGTTYPTASGQSIRMLDVPTWSGMGVGFVSFLNNVKTATNFFIQNGILYPKSQGVGYPNPTYARIMYTHSDLGLIPVTYLNLVYVAGHDYTFTIAKVYASPDWYACATHHEYNIYECSGPVQAGPVMAATQNTNVWVEVQSTALQWYLQFSPQYIQFSEATTVVSGLHYDWTSEHLYTAYSSSCGTQYPWNNAFSGQLSNNGIGIIYLNHAPRQCN
jgi:hypothetical protein